MTKEHKKHVRKYIKKHKKAGFSKGEIKEVLVKAGHDPKTVERHFKEETNVVLLEGMSFLCFGLAFFLNPLFGFGGIVMALFGMPHHKRVTMMLILLNLIGAVGGFMIYEPDLEKGTIVNGDFEKNNLEGWELYKEPITLLSGQEGEFVSEQKYYAYGDDDSYYFILRNNEEGMKLSLTQTVVLDKENIRDCTVAYRYKNPQQLRDEKRPDFVYSIVLLLDEDYGVEGSYHRVFRPEGAIYPYDTGSTPWGGYEITEQGKWVPVSVSLGWLMDYVGADVGEVEQVQIGFGSYNGNGEELYVAVDDVRLECGE